MVNGHVSQSKGRSRPLAAVDAASRSKELVQREIWTRIQC
jgi:hypothetical protein